MDPYNVLGCTPSTPLGEIETKYRLLLRHHHPDLHQSEGADAVAHAERATQALNAAIGSIRAEHRSRSRRDHGFSHVHENAHERAHRDSHAGGAESRPPPGHWFGGEPIDHDPDEPVPCPYCGRGFVELDDFLMHLGDAHRLHDNVARRRPRTLPSRTVRGRVAAKLRLVPAGFVALIVAASLIGRFPVWFVLASMVFLLVVMWAHTVPRSRHPSIFDNR